MDDNPDTPQPSATLGDCLMQARERAGFSLRNLEAITDISRPMLHRLEHDQVDHPNPSVLHRLAEALEIDSDDLFAFVGYRPSEKLPSLAPYLRIKYHLPPAAIAEAHDVIRSIVEMYDHERDNS